MKVALIPSDNGLGHIRRMTLLSNFISNKFQVTIFINKKKLVFNLSKKLKTEKIKSLFNLKKKTYKLLNKNDIKKILKLKNFNYIIVDNLPDLLSLSKKIILFSNFFWHRELHSKNPKFKQIENQLVKRKIKIFGNYLFQKKYFSKFNNTKIPFFGNYKKNLNKKNILISIGTARYNEVENIVNNLKFYNNKIHNNTGYGIYSSSNYDLEVYNNIIRDNNNDGIYATSLFRSEFINNTVIDNSDGMELRGNAYSVTISGNTIKDNSASGIQIYRFTGSSISQKSVIEKQTIGAFVL